MLKLTTRGWFFYRVPEHFGFSAQEACLPRDILWHLPCSRWRDVQIELSTVPDFVVCIWRLWTERVQCLILYAFDGYEQREYSAWYCCMHLTVMNRERVQCLLLSYAFDGYEQVESTVSDFVVCIWRLWTGGEYNAWYCCMHLTVMNRERVQCLILYAFDGYEQGESTVSDIVVCIWYNAN
jgi:hypothetical protein